MLEKTDPEVFRIIKNEEERQKNGLELIPSENYASTSVMQAAGSILNDKYAENYPGRRYYGGCVNVDELESLCQRRAVEAFNATGYHVNVQPYSGSPANLAVFFGLLEIGDTVMSLKLENGGHLTHGSPVNLSGRLFKFVHYGLLDDDTIDYDALEKLAHEHKPKIILSGFTAYPRIIDFKRVHEIAKSAGAVSMADISHISGLVIGGAHPSPFPFTDVVTTTTHKTLRGPRGAVIFCKQEFKERVDRAVFPGMQGGPHEHTIAGIAVAFAEAMKPSFKTYAEQIVKNSKILAKTLQDNGMKLVSDGTDNHLMLIDLRQFGAGRGVFIEKALEACGISVNKSSVPNDPSPPYYPSGIRLGTPAITTRGMKEKDVEQVGRLVSSVIKEFSGTNLPDDKEKRSMAVKEFTKSLGKNDFINETRSKVKSLASKFPMHVE